jgi:hypothetical protein
MGYKNMDSSRHSIGSGTKISGTGKYFPSLFLCQHWDIVPNELWKRE